MTTHAFSLPAFGKINLSLRILGKRADGYHEIQTVLQTISLRDSLYFRAVPSAEIVFSCDDPRIPTDSSNLVVRAAKALRDCFGIATGASIHLEKRVPAKGGLGGGSSDAAVTLLGLSRLWRLDATPSQLANLAAGLGADVPFFLEGGRALATGIGTRLTPLPDGVSQRLLIVSPGATVSTVDAYKVLNAPALTTSDSDSILAISRTEAIFSDSEQWPLCDHVENDFERVIFDMEPEVRRARNALLGAGARCALLAGSGSSVFGIFESEDVLNLAANTLRAERGWRIFSCVTLSRDEYLRALSSTALGR